MFAIKKMVNYSDDVIRCSKQALPIVDIENKYQ